MKPKHFSSRKSSENNCNIGDLCSTELRVPISFKGLRIVEMLEAEF